MSRMAERLAAKALDQKQLLAILDQVPRRWREYHRRVYIRRLHYWNDDAVNPGVRSPGKPGDYEYDGDLVGLGEMPGAISHIAYQTDIPRKVGEEAKDRLLENPWIVGVTPIAPGFSEKKAEDVAEVFNSGLRLVEERNGFRFQDALADGQIVDGFQWMHWGMARDFYPPVPEYEFLDELPEDEKEAKRFTESDDKEKGKVKETEDSLRERTKHKRARAGFPFFVEFPDNRTVYSVDDQAGEDAMVIHVRRIPMIEYASDFEGDKIQLKQANGKLRLYTEADGPGPEDPSWGDWQPSSMATVATVWTRDEWYEMASLGTLQPGLVQMDDWQLMKSGVHPYGRPPFVKCIANRFNHPDPVRRYTPYLEGLFRLKPFYDRTMALTMGLAEKGLPWLILKNLDPASGGIDESGRESTGLVPDSAMADELPPGYDIQAITAELTQSHMKMVEELQRQFEEARPPTGIADIQASTKPWTARTAIQQADKGPKRLIGYQADAILTMVRSMARVISMKRKEGGFGDTVWAYRMGEGRTRTNEVVGIEPEDVESLDITVSINPISTAEQLTLEQHGMELIDAGLLTVYEWLKEYKRVVNPTEAEAVLLVEKLMNLEIIPGWFRQKVAEIFGEQYKVGANGSILDSQGSSVDPRELLAEQGIQAQQGAAGGTPGAQAGGAFGSTLAPTMDDLRDQPPPGVMPQPPVPG